MQQMTYVAVFNYNAKHDVIIFYHYELASTECCTSVLQHCDTNNKQSLTSIYRSEDNNQCHMEVGTKWHECKHYTLRE